MNRKYRSSRPCRIYKKKAPGRCSKRRGFFNVKDEELYESLKDEVIELQGCDLGICAEWFANSYNVPIHRITQTFQKLNHEGILSQRVNRYHGAMQRGDPMWNASYYYIRKK